MPAARAFVTNVLARDKRILVRARMCSISVGIAVLTVGFTLKTAETYGIGSVEVGPQTEPAGISVFEKIPPKRFNLQTSLNAQTTDSVASESAVEERQSEPSVFTKHGASFDERFFFDQHAASFDERFAGASAPDSAAAKMAETEERASDAFPKSEGLGANARPALGQSEPDLPPVTSSPPKRLRTEESPKALGLLSDIDSRTAIYDIAAHTVYLPNGHKLEAHSGLGTHLDDPRDVNLKGRGPTPPNAYALALREQLFHGVRAIRLIPVGGGMMFGRDGMLAHSYMLGPNGQSNGCVSFNNYPAFLNAFLRGEVNRLVVIEHLAAAPSGKTASSGWALEAIKNLFRS